MKAKKENGKCILCGKSTRREKNPLRPLCNICEEHAPVCMSAPGLFMDSANPAGMLAKATYKLAEKNG